MLFLVTVLLFGLSVVITSSFVFEAVRWRVAMAITVGCAALLTTWSAELLQRLLRFVSVGIGLLPALGIAALPFAAILLRLLRQRLGTALHVPGPEDDPVLRRHLEEKLRRLRQQRQQEALLEASDEPVDGEVRKL